MRTNRIKNHLCAQSGASGGIDSAVTSTLCAQTGLKTICLQLPIHQAQSHVDRKLEHISQLQNRFSNVSAINIDLSETFEQLKKALPNSENEAAFLLS